MQQVQQGRAAGTAAVFAAMQRAEELHRQEQAGPASKRARLLHKLEGGAGSSAGFGSSAGALTDTQLQAATRQLARVLSGNEALVAEAGQELGSAAAELVQQLAAGGPSKPVFQGKLSNLAMQLKKAGSVADVPALLAALGSNGSMRQAAQAAGLQAPAVPQAAAIGAAEGAAAGNPPGVGPLSQQQFQQQVNHALALAGSASPMPGTGSTDSSAAAVAAAALQALAAAAVTVDLLAATGAGRRVQQLKKHAAPAVATAAAEVVAAWKARLKAAGAG